MNSSRHVVERWTSWTLRLGVWISAAFMVAGLLLTLVIPQSASEANPTISEVFAHLVYRPIDAVTVSTTGLLLLMFTPLLRVMTAVFGFVTEKDWTFASISLAVFLMLAGELVYSLL
ncbi:MAG: DUF1634 domain-containing protein [Ignavibacteriales bacterium]|nr:DUF1634 domain-containing protein [Ignavibacteriales bacterium]